MLNFFSQDLSYPIASLISPPSRPKQQKPPILVSVILKGGNSPIINKTTKNIGATTIVDKDNIKKRKKYHLSGKYSEIQITYQQINCIAYFVQGMSNQEIAKEMNISEHVVYVHFRRMLFKFGFPCKKKLVQELIMKTNLMEHIKIFLLAQDADYLEELLIGISMQNV